MKRSVVLSLVVFLVGIFSCVPAIKIFYWVATTNSSEISISGFDIALLLSAVGGGALVGAAWIFVGGRESR